MGSIDILRTDEEIEFVSDMMGDTFFETSTFDTYLLAVEVEARRDRNTKALRKLDFLCERLGLKYFVYEKTLQGVIAYRDFIPGEFDVYVGMLRSDYDKLMRWFKRATYEDIEDAGLHISWKIPTTRKKSKAFYVKVLENHPSVVRKNGDIVYGSGSSPMMVTGQLLIAPFDFIPDDFFTRKKFFRQMKRRNDFYKRSLTSRGIEVEPYSYEHPYFSLIHQIVPIMLSAWDMQHLSKRYRNYPSEYVARLIGWRSPMLPFVDLGEMPYRDFRGVKVRTPQNPMLWAGEPILETTPELRRLQNDAKEIVVEIDRVCKELGIEYFACGGTMLGDVRHGGFIPWDDDIDLGMLREDYEIFKNHANEVMDTKRFFLQTRQTDPLIPYLFSKVRMNGTEYITNYNLNRNFHKGICVDVFPFDYVPNPGSDLRSFRKEVRAASKRHNWVVNRQYPELYEKSTPVKHNFDWLISQIIGRIHARWYWHISLDETQQTYDETVQRYNELADELDLEYVASFVPTYTMARVADLKPYQRIDFDGIMINIPAKPEIFLRMQYGDYMVPPYPHQRCGHDLLLWSDADGIGGGRITDK